MAATIHPLGPSPRGQDADDASARFRTTAIGGGCLDDPGEIPAGPPVRLGHLQGTPCFAAVERNRSDPDDDFVAVRIAQADFADRQPVGQRWIDNYGADLLRHEHSPPVADG
jgi:hypothetical protein